LNKKIVKILGSGPTGSLLALSLASSNCEVILVDPLSDEELVSRDKGYALTQSSRRIFQEMGLWNSIEEFATGFDSLSIIDDELSQSVIVRTNDLKKINKGQENIGWVLEHKHLMNILIKSINCNKFIKKLTIDDTNDETFDFVLAADGRDSSSRKNWQIKYFKRLYKQKCISFRAILANLPKRRAYEIFRHEGPLALLPLDNNIYQIIWFGSLSETKLRLELSNQNLLEMLSNSLPDKIQAINIVSEISYYSVAQAFAFPKFNNYQNVLVGDSAHSFHPVGGQGLNSCIRDVYELSDLIKKNQTNSFLKIKFFALNYFFKRFLDIFSLIIFTDLLIKVFSNKLILLYPLRHLIFYMLRKIKLLRINVFSLMTDSLKSYDLK